MRLQRTNWKICPELQKKVARRWIGPMWRKLQKLFYSTDGNVFKVPKGKNFIGMGRKYWKVVWPPGAPSMSFGGVVKGVWSF